MAPGTIVENKRLGATLASVKEQQGTYAPNRRRYDPTRQRPPNNLEAPGPPPKGRPSHTGPDGTPRLGRAPAAAPAEQRERPRKTERGHSGDADINNPSSGNPETISPAAQSLRLKRDPDLCEAPHNGFLIDD